MAKAKSRNSPGENFEKPSKAFRTSAVIYRRPYSTLGCLRQELQEKRRLDLYLEMLDGKSLMLSCIRGCWTPGGLCCLVSKETRRHEAHAALHLGMLDNRRLMPPCIPRYQTAGSSSCLASRDARWREANAALHPKTLDGKKLMLPCFRRYLTARVLC